MHINSEKTVLTVTNAIALASAIVQEVAGNEVADTLNGNVVTNAAMQDVIGSQINKFFSDFTSQGVQK